MTTVTVGEGIDDFSGWLDELAELRVRYGFPLDPYAKDYSYKCNEPFAHGWENGILRTRIDLAQIVLERPVWWHEPDAGTVDALVVGIIKSQPKASNALGLLQMLRVVEATVDESTSDVTS